jgi:predicted PurR-regulated permease PerM
VNLSAILNFPSWDLAVSPEEFIMNQPVLTSPVRNAIEIAVYLLLIFAIVAWCLQILMPFVSFLLWGMVIAIAVYNPFLSLRRALGERNKLAVLIFVLLGLGVIILPTWMFAGSLIDSAQELRGSLESGQFDIPPANESVKDWPLVGERVYANWSAAAANFEGWLEDHSEQVKAIVEGGLSRAAGIGLAVIQFIAATLIAAAMLANDETTKAMIRRFFQRLVGDRADEFLDLTTATIRSVTVGVLGIAFIQALLGGLGMVLVGVPAAGVWALFILILAIAQLPPLLVLLPAIVYVFSTGDSTTVAVLFTIWSLIVSFSDAILKPILLGRGVEAPMLVILLGAIGGMLYSGIIGLFLGAVILALGYKLLQAWMDSGPERQPEEA